MSKITLFICLFTVYVIYTAVVYSKGTENTVQAAPADAAKIRYGKQLFQQYNCTSCHQLFGLGGYLGPELTTAYSDPARGELYMKAFLQAGGPRMPNFHFQKEAIDAIICYLKYIDTTAITYKTH